MFQFASQADGASADAKIIVSSGLSFLFCFFFFLVDGQKVALVPSLHVGLQKEHGKPCCRQACWATHP